MEISGNKLYVSTSYANRGPFLKEYIYVVVPTSEQWIYRTWNVRYIFVWSTQLGARFAQKWITYGASNQKSRLLVDLGLSSFSPANTC